MIFTTFEKLRKRYEMNSRGFKPLKIATYTNEIKFKPPSCFF